MTPEQIKQMMPLLTAYAEGKEIQCCINGGWEDVRDLILFATPQLYRAKPEKKKGWVNIYEDGGDLHWSRIGADEGTFRGRLACKEIEFEEGEGL